MRKDGSRFWANVVIDAIRDRDGELIAFAKVTRDMTERVGAQAALRESEERFRILVQGVADYAIYMLDPEGRITNWNLGGERIKGYPADEIVGQHFSIFFTPEDRARGEPDREIRPPPRGAVRGRRLAGTQGRDEVLGRRRGRPDPRPGRKAARFRQGHPRHDREEEGPGRA